MLVRLQGARPRDAEEAARNVLRAVVLAVGPDARWGVKAEDTIVLRPNAGDRITIDGEELLLVSSYEIRLIES